MDSFWIYGIEELFGKLVSSDKGLPQNEAYVRLQRQRNKLKIQKPFVPDNIYQLTLNFHFILQKFVNQSNKKLVSL